MNRGHRVFLLCGYAGTGKSTVSRALLDLLAIRYPKEKIMCCAISGIASDRIRKLTRLPAQTIYSLVFKHQEKLPYEVLLVDESSMVNTELLFRLITRLADSAILIMVGDAAQLPPIGAGNPFSDIIEKQLAPTVTLTRIYRQSDDKVIALFANDIREARVPERYAAEGYGDFRFMDVSIPNYFGLKQKVKSKAMKEGDFKKLREENAQKIVTALCDTAATYKNLLMETYKNRDYAGYLSTLQVITPMKGGPLGTEQLNEALQKLLNEASARPERCVNLGQDDARPQGQGRPHPEHEHRLHPPRRLQPARPGRSLLHRQDLQRDARHRDRAQPAGGDAARLLSRRQDHRLLFVRRGEGTRAGSPTRSPSTRPRGASIGPSSSR